MNTLAINKLNEQEYADIEEKLRQRIINAGLNPTDNFHRQYIHGLRWTIHELWRQDSEPSIDEIEDWLR